MQKTAPAQHLAFVDALRGCAALVAAVYHCLEIIDRRMPEDPAAFYFRSLNDHFDLGKMAVVVFFMVSGYLIPQSLDRGTLSSFTIKRFFRLYPTYWLSIAVYLLLLPWLGQAIVPTAQRVLINLTMFQGFVGVPDLIGVFWTLQIELSFYLLCMLLFAAGLFTSARWRVAPAATIAALLMASARLSSGVKLPVALCLAIGLMFVADALRRRDAHYGKCMAFFLALLPVTCWLAYGGDAARYLVSYLVGIGVFVLADYGRAWRGFSSPGFTWLANSSYGMYLLHPSIGFAVLLTLLRWQVPSGMALFAALAVAALSSHFVYVFVEEPFIGLGHRLSKRKSVVVTGIELPRNEEPVTNP